MNAMEDAIESTLRPFTGDLAPLQTEFLLEGYIDLTHLMPNVIYNELKHAVGSTLDTSGCRRDIQVAVTDYSPRKYRLATRAALLASSPFLSKTYRSPSLQRIISAIVGEPVALVPYQPEEFVATRYEYIGDTHGWHWDDYAFALIWVFEAPPREAGGTLEYMLNIPWNKPNPGIDAALQKGIIHRRHPEAGTVYLLRTDTTLHRVTPLLTECRREILCFSYAASGDFQRTITHETIELLEP